MLIRRVCGQSSLIIVLVIKALDLACEQCGKPQSRLFYYRIKVRNMAIASSPSDSGVIACVRACIVMEVRSLKTEGIPATGYMTAQEAQPDMSDYLILRTGFVCTDSTAG